MNKIIQDINNTGLHNCLCPKNIPCTCHLDLVDLDGLHEAEITTSEVEEAMDWRKEAPSHENLVPTPRQYDAIFPRPELLQGPASTRKPAGAGERHLHEMYLAALLHPEWKPLSCCPDCNHLKLTKDDPQGVESICHCGYNFYPFA